jgi:hypothetical protein
MTITLPLPSDLHAELERRASAAGTDVEHLIIEAVQQQLVEDDDSLVTASYDEWSREFRRWVAAQRPRNPRFDDSRESIYD